MLTFATAYVPMGTVYTVVFVVAGIALTPSLPVAID
jgi:hypothetical protein